MSQLSAWILLLSVVCIVALTLVLASRQFAAQVLAAYALWESKGSWLAWTYPVVGLLFIAGGVDELRRGRRLGFAPLMWGVVMLLCARPFAAGAVGFYSAAIAHPAWVRSAVTSIGFFVGAVAVSLLALELRSALQEPADPSPSGEKAAPEATDVLILRMEVRVRVLSPEHDPHRPG